MTIHNQNQQQFREEGKEIGPDSLALSLDPSIRAWALELRELLTSLEYQRNLRRPNLERIISDPEVTEAERNDARTSFDSYSKLMHQQRELTSFLVRTLPSPCNQREALLKEAFFTHEHPLLHQAIMEAYGHLPYSPSWLVDEAKLIVLKNCEVKSSNGFSKKELGVLAAHAALNDSEMNTLYSQWIRFQWNDFVALAIMDCLARILKRRDDWGQSLIITWLNYSKNTDQKQRLLRLADTIGVSDVVTPKVLLKFLVDDDESLSQAATQYTSHMTNVDDKIIRNLFSQVERATPRASTAATQLSLIKPDDKTVMQEVYKLLLSCEKQIGLYPSSELLGEQEHLPFSGFSSSEALERRSGFYMTPIINLFGAMRALGNLCEQNTLAVNKWESYLYQPDPIYREILINSFPSQITEIFFQKILIPYFSRVAIEALPNSTMRLFMHSANAGEYIDRLVKELKEFVSEKFSGAESGDFEERIRHLLGVKMLCQRVPHR